MVDRTFSKVDDLLFHLSVIHFSKDLLEIAPYAEDSRCKICEEQGVVGKLSDVSSLSTHLTHIGVTHREALKLLPPQLAQTLSSLDLETEVTFKSIAGEAESHVNYEAETATAPPLLPYGSQGVEDQFSLTNDIVPPFGSFMEAEPDDFNKLAEQNPETNEFNGGQFNDHQDRFKEPLYTSDVSRNENAVTNNVESYNEKRPVIETTAPSAFEETRGASFRETEDSKPTLSSVRCEMCPPSKTREYNKRSDYLKHLSLSHYGKQILAAFPHVSGSPCSLCVEAGGKSWSTPKREVHVCHIGVLHAKVFDFLPNSLVDVVQCLPQAKRGRQPGTEAKVRQDQDRGATTHNRDASETLNELPEMRDAARAMSPVF